MNLNFLQFFQGADGDYSSMRFVMVIWCLGVLFDWMFISIAQMTLQAIPESVIVAIGIFVTGKAVHKQMEKPQKNPRDERNCLPDG